MSAVEKRQGLLAQVRDLDNRFWIVNVMEMFERLAYYGVRAVIPLYLVLSTEEGGPQLNHSQKATIFAWWAAMQSVLPMFTGGWADRYGHKMTISIAILVKIAGYVILGQAHTYEGLMTGCLLLAAGTAIFKPGVQGTLAATLKKSNASVGWGVFYQLVNVGGFLGPVVAGVLRLMDWSYVFYVCAGIVAINFAWLPFYQDPSRDASSASHGKGIESFAALSQSVSLLTARIWLGISVGLSGWFIWLYYNGQLGVGVLLVSLLFPVSFAVYAANKTKFDTGQSDPISVLIVSIVGLFQARVLFFCLAFSGFWFMFNQVFDLLPNVIDDWVDSSSIVGTLGSAFSTATVPTLLAIGLGLLFGAICAVVVLLAMRPDRRTADQIPGPAYVVVSIGLAAAFAVAGTNLGPWSALAGAGVGLAIAAIAFVTRQPAKPFAIVAFLVGAVGSLLAMRTNMLAIAPDLVALAEAGQQVNPEWMINLNPGLIVFTMVFFAYLSSFVRPMTSILVGMGVATAGSYFAGTATLGWACLGGILIFSVGEMLSSPKKMEYLASLAKPGQEGIFMGYANIPVAIGWIAGSLVAGNAYEKHGDKVNLARRHLKDVLDLDASFVDAIPKSEVMTTLSGKLGGTVMDAQHLLYDTYHPEAMWFSVAMVGVVSMVLMVVYDLATRYIDKRGAQPVG